MDTQLELFQVPATRSPRRGERALGCVQLRQDHAVLLAIAGLIGVSVTFAGGVERGKQLVLAEQLSLGTRLATAMTERMPVEPAASRDAASNTETPARKTPGADAGTPAHAAPTTPSQPPAERSRFAIQVVTYSQPRLAQQELKRLQARGERAFLIMKGERTVLYVGPYPTKATASAKLVRLKQTYRDCFIRSL